MINFSRAAGSQHHGLCATGFNRFFITIPDPRAHHPARAGQADFIGDNKVNGVTAFQYADIRVGQRLAHQGSLHSFTGRIGGVENSAVAMTSLPGQMVALFAVRLNLSIKQHALID